MTHTPSATLAYDHLTEPFFTTPTFGNASLQVLKELGAKHARFRQAFNTTMNEANGNAEAAAYLDEDALRALANDAQAFGFYMTPDQAGRFAAEEVLRLARSRAAANQK